MTSSPDSEGSVLGGQKSSAVTSFDKGRLDHKRVSRIPLFPVYIICNGSPPPQGVTSLIKFNRIQNVAREDVGRVQLQLNRGYYLG